MRSIWRLAILPALALCTGAADAPKWREDATRLEYDGTLHLKWANSLGDWLDATGKPLGAVPFASAEGPRGGRMIHVEIDVTKMVRQYGADFRINTVGGLAKLGSHRSPEGGSMLRVTRGGQTTTLQASADTYMDATTFNPLGSQPFLNTHYGALVRFDRAADPAITRAVLVLNVLNSYSSAPRFLIFRPAFLNTPTAVSPGATYTPAVPEKLKTNPAVASKLRRLDPEPAHAAPGRVLFEIGGAKLKARPNSRVEGDTMAAWFEGATTTAISDIVPLPGNRTDAYLTVIAKIGTDWTAPGGKLPGLANTGQIAKLSAICVMGVLPVKPGGWGGRLADGCHWSARTLYRGVRDGSVGAGTYLYALSPKDVNGVADYWSLPLPKARWFAYVEHVKLNTPGHADGEIAYWLIDRASAPAGRRVEAAGGIVYRDTAVPQSAINELWADVYCGGRDCGAAPWPRSTFYLKKMTVTDALPDMAAVQAELDRLNGAH